jgi:adenylate kinase family enzyme
MRVHITGGPGSGKTTVANKVAALLGVAAFDLDLVAWDGDSERPPSLRDQDLRAIMEHSGWVTEGIYLGWTEPLFREADLILWLDPSWPVAAWRVLLRHVKADLRGNNAHPGYRRLWRFLRICRRYYTETGTPINDAGVPWPNRRFQAVGVMPPYSLKVRTVRNNRELRAVLEELSRAN